MQTLATVQRCKGFKKRPLRTMLLQLGPDFQVQVQLFQMLHKAVKTRKVRVDAVSNAQVVRESAALDADTGMARLPLPSQRTLNWRIEALLLKPFFIASSLILPDLVYLPIRIL